jgi:hypothetical protein
LQFALRVIVLRLAAMLSTGAAGTVQVLGRIERIVEYRHGAFHPLDRAKPRPVEGRKCNGRASDRGGVNARTSRPFEELLVGRW